ncbi:MAG: nitrile hydratase subunit beta [Neomegalonema sp.]|nr:nitrile hydratase subunit beta [Neomegalonema sp.]
MVEPPPNFNPADWDPLAPKPRFSCGRRVRVRDVLPADATPEQRACLGKTGVVARIAGHFPSPSTGESMPLYELRFALCDLYPGHDPSDGETVDIALFEESLQPFWDYGGDFDAQGAALELELRDMHEAGKVKK